MYQYAPVRIKDGHMSYVRVICAVMYIKLECSPFPKTFEARTYLPYAENFT